MFSRRHILSLVPAAAALSACANSPVIFDELPGLPTAPRTPPFPSGVIDRIALTSCSNQSRGLEMFDQVRAKQPDLLLMLGDNVYGSASSTNAELPDLRDAYTKMAASQPFRNLVSGVPTQAIWDDHDFGINDGGGDFLYKGLAQRMFNSFWNVPANDVLRRRAGIYRAFTTGPLGKRVQVILLDTRTFRDPLISTDIRGAPGKERYLPHAQTASADVLGAEQWQFLERELKKPADVRIIASSIQVVADGHGYECWALFPRRRQQLYDLIARLGAKGVVFVSGDRHHGSINRTDKGTLYPLTDFTASAINMPSRLSPNSTMVSEASTTRIGDGYGPVNFGMINLDWTQRRVGLDLIGADDTKVLTHMVPFTELGMG
jgi:alkaline phosphatase D